MKSSHHETVKPRQSNGQLLILSIFLFNDPFMFDRIKQIAFMGRDLKVNHGVKDYISWVIEL